MRRGMIPAVLVSAVTLAGCTIGGEAVGGARLDEAVTSGSSSLTSAAATDPDPSTDPDPTATAAPVEDEIVLVAHGVLDRSTDGGVTWKQVELDRPVHALAGTDATVVALSGVGGEPSGQILRSADGGGTWEVVEEPAAVLTHLSSGPDGFLAVGVTPEVGMRSGPLRLDLAASRDGRTWTSGTAEIALVGEGYTSIADLAWTGTTWTAAVVSGVDEGSPATEILTSEDGLTWTADPVWPVPVAPGALAWTGTALGMTGHVLDGYTFDDDIRPHTRPVGAAAVDGAWTVGVPEPIDRYLGELTCTSDGWLGLSVQWWDQDQGVAPQLHRSDDLTAWEPTGTALPASAPESTASALGADLLVLGSAADPAACRTGWTTPLADFAAIPPEGSTAVGSAPTGSAPPNGAPTGDVEFGCEITGSDGRTVYLGSNVTAMPGYPPSALGCDEMTASWENHLAGNPDGALSCTVGPDQNAIGGSLTGFLAGCPVSAAFAVSVAEPGSEAAAAVEAHLRQYLAGTAPTADTGPVTGDLGLSVPMTRPVCDGTVAVVVGSAVNPATYATDVQAFLDAHPGASYLRTDQACPSLVQATAEGNPIYAVYFPHPAGTGCEAVATQGGDAYARRLDTSSPADSQLPC